MGSDNLRILAGGRAYERIRSGGFGLDEVATCVGPAVGPRWLLASGFDRTLIREGALGGRQPLWLVGASAGAWRFAAWLQPQAEENYRALIDAYIGATYARGDGPEKILRSLQAIVDRYVADDALPFALANRRYRLAILTCRAKHLVASERRWLQRAGLGAAFVANALHPELMGRFAERVVFHHGLRLPDFCLRPGFRGRFFPLSETNFKPALLASGAIPLAVAGVRDIFGAADGVYRDGGLLDYHINQDFGAENGGLTLLFHHQERIVPGWLDQRLKKRRPPERFLDSLLMVCPTEGFVAALPNGRVPDRGDILTFIDDPATRIANWRRAVQLSSSLGEEFLELVRSGRLRERVERL